MLSLEIITPFGTTVTTTGDEVSVPTASGIIGVRHGHLPLIAPLKPGEIVVHHDAKRETEHYVVTGGFVEVLPDSVRILADAAEHTTDADEAKVQEAIRRAESLKKNAQDQRQLTQAAAMIEMQMAKLKVVQRKKRR